MPIQASGCLKTPINAFFAVFTSFLPWQDGLLLWLLSWGLLLLNRASMVGSWTHEMHTILPKSSEKFRASRVLSASRRCLKLIKPNPPETLANSFLHTCTVEIGPNGMNTSSKSSSLIHDSKWLAINDLGAWELLSLGVIHVEAFVFVHSELPKEWHGQGFSCIENYEAAASAKFCAASGCRQNSGSSHVQASLNSVH